MRSRKNNSKLIHFQFKKKATHFLTGTLCCCVTVCICVRFVKFLLLALVACVAVAAPAKDSDAKDDTETTTVASDDEKANKTGLEERGIFPGGFGGGFVPSYDQFAAQHFNQGSQSVSFFRPSKNSNRIFDSVSRFINCPDMIVHLEL